jgi:dCTP deaminase
MNDYWSQIAVGTIVDEDITGLARVGELIVEEFDPSCVKQACYELRASRIFYETASGNENKRIEIPSGSRYVLKPQCYVTAIVMEKIQLPSHVLGRVLTKGQLFSLGILPVNTYADPGFDGRLGITLCNISHRYVVIRPGQAIAKIEFAVLPKPVKHPYSGQHGFETGIWPIPTQYYANKDELRVEGLVGTEADELAKTYGPPIADLARRLDFYARRVWMQILITIFAFLLLFALYDKLTLVQSVLIGIVANLITHFGIEFVRKRQR